jgi:signal peptidase
MTAIAPVAAGGPDIGRALGRAVARASGAYRELLWPWAAGAALIGPLRWWAECFVLLTAWSQTPAASAGRRLADRILRPVRALRRPPVTAPVPVTDPADDDPRPPGRTRRWYPTPRGTFHVLVWTAVVTCVGAFAASLAVPAWYGLHDQQLLIVTSGSMSPFVEAGDVAVLQSIDDPSQLRVGQVVTFWPPGSKHLVTHRIVDLQMLAVLEDGEDGHMVPRLDGAGEPITRPYVYTKGDANRTRDPNATPLSLVRGVVVAAHPGWGFWLGWAQSPTGRLTMLAPPLVLLGGLELVEALVERRRRPVRRTIVRPEVIDALGTF